MFIVLTCDLGMTSPGLIALANGLADLGQLAIWATPQSWRQREDYDTSMTAVEVDVHPLPNGMTGWCCTGSPAQTVALAIATHTPEAIDLIVSGINTTPRTAANATEARSYNAGVAAASEGLAWQIPCLSVSLDWLSYEQGFYKTAVSVTRQLIQEQQQEPPRLTNITIPRTPTTSWQRQKRPLQTYYQTLQTKQPTPSCPKPSPVQITTLTLPDPLAKALYPESQLQQLSN